MLVFFICVRDYRAKTVERVCLSRAQSVGGNHVCCALRLPIGVFKQAMSVCINFLLWLPVRVCIE